MTGFAAVDLDGTILLRPSDAERASCPVIVDAHARARRWMDRDHLEVFRRLAARGVVVPATARSFDQYTRLGLFSDVADARWAVAANGALILRGGEIDSRWLRHWQRHADELSPSLRVVAAIAEASLEARWRVVEGAFLVGVCATAAVARDAPSFGPAWRTVRDARKVYVLPRSLDKVAAIREIVRRTGVGFAVAAGDSALDRRMLADAPIAVVVGGRMCGVARHVRRAPTPLHTIPLVVDALRDLAVPADRSA